MLKQLFSTVTIVLALLVLIIPTAAQGCGSTITVEAGDNLYDIARECGTTVPAIVEANISINNPAILNVGQTLTIPSDVDARQPQVNVYPQRVSPGDSVQITANGFPLTTDVRVLIGIDGTDAVIPQIATTDEQGALITTIAIPTDVEINERWVAVVETVEGPVYDAISYAFFVTEATEAPVTATPLPDNVFTQTQIYLIQSAPGNRDVCTDTTVPFAIEVEPTVAPLTAALNRLFIIGEQPYGYYNALANRGFSISGIDIEDGLATIDLTGNTDVLTACDTTRIEAQIRQTATQFSTIDDVSIRINGQPFAAQSSNE